MQGTVGNLSGLSADKDLRWLQAHSSTLYELSGAVRAGTDTLNDIGNPGARAKYRADLSPFSGFGLENEDTARRLRLTNDEEAAKLARERLPLEQQLNEALKRKVDLERASAQATDPDAQVIELWAVQNEQQGLSIWDHASVRAQIANLTNPVQRGFILQGMKTIASGQQYFFDTAGDGSGTIAVVSKPVLRAIADADGFSGTVFDQMMLDLAGQSPDIQWNLPIYTRQLVAPLASSVRASYDLQNRMLSVAGFLSRFPGIPTVFRDNIATHLAGGYFRAGGVEGNQVDGATAQITQRFYFTASIPSEFRWGTVLTS